MIGKLKKFVGTESEAAGIGLGIPVGVKVMGAHLQRKFARGVQYNMKVIIKGERNTGKSTLLYRLQGYKFVPEYNGTDEIQVAVIHWTAATSDEVVKVDIWDIVDKGKNRKKAVGLKLSNDQSEDNSLMDSCLDADFLDVYQGTHAVIFTFDITKKWTYDYVIKNLPLVPHEIPVLVMANFMDNQENRVVTENSGMRLLRSAANRPLVGAPVVVIESSLKNGFGLKMVHQFLNLPFLSLQRKSLHQMLESNKANQLKMNELFQTIDDNKDCDYSLFLQKLEDRKSSPEKSMSPSTSAIMSNAAFNHCDSSTNASSPGKRNEEIEGQQTAQNVLSVETGGNREGFGSKLTRIFSRRQKGSAAQAAKADSSKADNLDSFLSDERDGVDGAAKRTTNAGDDESDEGNGNPMVEDIYEDFASDENSVFQADLDAYKEKLVDLSSKEVCNIKSRRKISTASEDEIKDINNTVLHHQEPEIVFVSEEPSPTMSPKRKTSKTMKKISKHQSKVESIDQNSTKESSSSSSVRRTKKFTSNRAKKQFRNERLKSSESSGSSSSETSEGGDVPQGSEMEPTSEDLEADFEFKSFIEKQNETPTVAEQQNVSRKSKYLQMNRGKMPKGNLINETSSSDSENDLVSLGSEGIQKKQSIEKSKGAMPRDGEVQTKNFDEHAKVSMASSDEGTLFLSGKERAVGLGSEMINVLDVNRLSWEKNVSMESSKNLDKSPIITPQSSVGIEGDSAPIPLSPTALNLTFNTGDLDFLEAAMAEEKELGKNQTDSLVPKDKKKSKKKSSNADSKDVPEKEKKKKSKKTKYSKSRRNDENEVDDSPGIAEDVKGSKKKNKEQLVLLELEDPELDETLIAADIGHFGHDSTGKVKIESPVLEKKESKLRKSVKSKNKKTAKDSNDSEKVSNKKKRSSMKQSEIIETDSSATNEPLQQEQQYHKNDGYESL